MEGTMKRARLGWFGAVVALAVAAVPVSAAADGCYICTTGSSSICEDYCRYTGADTGAARRLCHDRGCVIGGTASCPQAVNYHICRVEPRAPEVAACVAPADAPDHCGG